MNRDDKLRFLDTVCREFTNRSDIGGFNYRGVPSKITEKTKIMNVWSSYYDDSEDRYIDKWISVFVDEIEDELILITEYEKDLGNNDKIESDKFKINEVNVTLLEEVFSEYFSQ
jgi:hypothetical protein